MFHFYSRVSMGPAACHHKPFPSHSRTLLWVLFNTQLNTHRRQLHTNSQTLLKTTSSCSSHGHAAISSMSRRVFSFLVACRDTSILYALQSMQQTSAKGPPPSACLRTYSIRWKKSIDERSVTPETPHSEELSSEEKENEESQDQVFARKANNAATSDYPLGRKTGDTGSPTATHRRHNDRSSSATVFSQSQREVNHEHSAQRNRRQKRRTSSVINDDEINRSAEDLDLEDLRSVEESFAPFESHIIRLERFKRKGKLSVTDFSAQLWCEKQLEFTLITGKKTFTKAMQRGVARHELLEKQDHEVVEVEVETREDDLGIRLLNGVTLLKHLQETGRAREIWVFGCINGVLIRGIIDELEIRTDTFGRKGVVITDTKTRAEEREPSRAQQQSSALQLQLYRWMVNELHMGNVDFDLLFQAFRCQADAPFSTELMKDYSNLRDVASAYRAGFEVLPPIEQYVEVVYECNTKEFTRKAIPYSESSTLYTAHEFLDWWIGSRQETQPVLQSERWKCRYCDFLSVCQATPLKALGELEEALQKQKERKAIEDKESRPGAERKSFSTPTAEQRLVNVHSLQPQSKSPSPLGQPLREDTAITLGRSSAARNAKLLDTGNGYTESRQSVNVDEYEHPQAVVVPTVSVDSQRAVHGSSDDIVPLTTEVCAADIVVLQGSQTEQRSLTPLSSPAVRGSRKEDRIANGKQHRAPQRQPLRGFLKEQFSSTTAIAQNNGTSTRASPECSLYRVKGKSNIPQRRKVKLVSPRRSTSSVPFTSTGITSTEGRYPAADENDDCSTDALRGMASQPKVTAETSSCSTRPPTNAHKRQTRKRIAEPKKNTEARRGVNLHRWLIRRESDGCDAAGDGRDCITVNNGVTTLSYWSSPIAGSDPPKRSTVQPSLPSEPAQQETGLSPTTPPCCKSSCRKRLRTW